MILDHEQIQDMTLTERGEFLLLTDDLWSKSQQETAVDLLAINDDQEGRESV